MTGQDLIDALHLIVDDDSMDDDLALFYINTALNELALERPWIWLVKRDVSITWATSDAYTTQHSLPSDFLAVVRIYAEGFNFELPQAPWEDQELYKNTSYKAMIDFYNKKLHFTGSTSEDRTIYLFYIPDQGDLAVSDSVLGWPAATQKLIAYKAADLWLAGSDADEVTKLMAPKHQQQYALMRARAVHLDAKMRGKARNYSSNRPNRDIKREPLMIDI